MTETAKPISPFIATARGISMEAQADFTENYSGSQEICRLRRDKIAGA